MRSAFFHLFIFISIFSTIGSCDSKPEFPLTAHPDSESWPSLFENDLSNAVYPDSVWSFEHGEITANEDQFLWTDKDYDNFIVDLEFKNADGTNSGVVVYCSDLDDWIPNSVEIQIADDFNEKWAKSPKSWQCGAIFGRKPATKSAVKKPGEWNRYTITCKDNMIYVLLNGQQVNQIDLTKFTDASTNPDGSKAPSWLSKAPSTLPTIGRIGFQGKHAGAPVYFRNIRIMEIE
jgi:hypothetical protein